MVNNVYLKTTMFEIMENSINNIKEWVINEDSNSLPPVELYKQYLEVASFKFKLTINECRNKFGLYTMLQWEELFNQPQLN